MSKVKGLDISREEVIKLAKNAAMKYVTSPKKMRLTPKQNKALVIYNAFKDVGGCQIENLMKGLDVLTGLPVSKSKPQENDSQKVQIQMNVEKWCKEHKFKVLRGSPSHKSLYMVLGIGTRVLSGDGGTCPIGDSYGTVTKAEVDGFFDTLREDSIGHLFGSLLK